MIVFNVKTYNDFGVPISALVMAAPPYFTKQAAKEVAAEAEKLFKTTDDVELVKRFLKNRGCTHVQSVDITIGGGL